MTRVFALSLMVTLLVAAAAFGQAEKDAGSLVPVEPVYNERVPDTPTQQSQPNSAVFPSPSPRDQLYVFWFLGKVLSYPVDRLEAYIHSKLNQPKAVPASATSTSNPFDSVNWREIPPAPPAR